MKKRIAWLLCVFVFFNVGSLFFYFKYNANTESILTKKSIFDIIDSIEDIVITSISTDGQGYLSEENKYDSIILYIVSNKSKFDEYIIKDENQRLDSENVNMGKIDSKIFLKLAEETFSDINLPIYKYKYFEDDKVNLIIEPFNYTIFDRKNILKQIEDRNGYKILVEYVTIFDKIENSIYVEYEIDFDYKIQNVIILSSNTF